jgi:hypothetical protein
MTESGDPVVGLAVRIVESGKRNSRPRFALRECDAEQIILFLWRWFPLAHARLSVGKANSVVVEPSEMDFIPTAPRVLPGGSF